MTEFLPDNIPPHYIETAEKIRGYLVSVRGGAPFLSGIDGQILVEWLDSSISPSIICSVIDKVALRRRKKRVKTRLTLKVCRGELNKIYKKNNKKSESQMQKKAFQKINDKQDLPHIDKLKERILAETLPIALHHQRVELLNVIEELREVHKSQKDVYSLPQRQKAFEPIVQKAIVVLVAMHQQIFEHTIDEHEQLHREAEFELTSLRTILPPVQWRDSVEEVVRDKLRQRYPSLRVGVIWDAINQN